MQMRPPAMLSTTSGTGAWRIMPPYPAGWSGRGRLVCRSISNTEVESPLLGSIPDRHSWMKKAFGCGGQGPMLITII